MKVGYLGPKGTFSYEAALEYCKNKEEMIEYKTISETIKALENDEVEEAIVPIENSIQGCVTEAIDTLIQNKNLRIKIIDEIQLEIKQNLMTKFECDFNDIEVVYSHPQAIAQCDNFLKKNLSKAKLVTVESTAGAAKKVSESKESNVACIGNIACLKEYNLNLVRKNIQDNDYNKTRFWILSNQENEKVKKTRMSIIFSIKDKPGALYNVLEIFNRYNINLTKIESRPAKTVLGEYIFWIDVAIENNMENDAIEEIKKKGIFVRILGKY